MVIPATSFIRGYHIMLETSLQFFSLTQHPSTLANLGGKCAGMLDYYLGQKT